MGGTGPTSLVVGVGLWLVLDPILLIVRMSHDLHEVICNVVIQNILD